MAGHVHDRHIWWKMKSLWLPWPLWISYSQVTGASTVFNFPNSAGAPVTAQAGGGATEMHVVQMGAAADEIQTWIPVPHDMDITRNAAARVWFIHSATGADTPIWKLFAKFFAKQAAITAGESSADETTTFAAHTCSTTDNSTEVTVWTELVWNDVLTTDDVLIALTLECDNLGSASANEIELFGLELAYYPAKMRFEGPEWAGELAGN